MKVSIIGCGNIGLEIAKYLDDSKFFDLVALNDLDKNKVDWLINSIKRKPQVLSFTDSILEADLIIEAAGIEAAKRLLRQNLLGKKIMILSTGVFVDEEILKSVEIYVPSGAISGLDSLKSVKGLINYLEIITTKPPSGLKGAPFFDDKKINFNIKQIVFEGSLKDALSGFPKNINVASTIKLATNFEPKIKIISDPNVINNSHRIIAKGDFGKFDFYTENKPSKNPKTSYLAILSAIQCLRNIESNFKLGS